MGAGSSPESSNSSEAVLDVIRRKLGKVQANLESNYESVIQRILPGKRKGTSSRPSSLYDSEAVWQPFPEQIEMASMKQRGTGRGHEFVSCQLTNPTWCDKCGDFIWGLYKQCQRCNSEYFLPFFPTLFCYLFAGVLLHVLWLVCVLSELLL